MTTDALKEALKQVKYPGFSRDIVSFGLVRSAVFADGTAKVSSLSPTSDPKVPTTAQDRHRVLPARSLPGVKEVVVELAVSAAKAPPAPGQANLAGGPRPPGIKHSVAIASGKAAWANPPSRSILACALAQVLEKRGRRAASA